MTTIKDLVIVGAGPAGITAAVYAARKKIDFTVISKDIGGQAAISGDIENYTGYQFISGPELAIKFAEHLKRFSFDLREGLGVERVEKEQQNFKIITSEGEQIISRVVIIATGKRPKLLKVPGEIEFKNRGVTYCATCDGPLFANKVVAVIGGGNSALDATLQMLRIAEKVYLININPRLEGDAVMVEKVAASSKVEILNSTRTLEIRGDKFVRAIKVTTAGKTYEIKLEGIFVEVGLVPNSELIDFVTKNRRGEIVVNCSTETSQPGVFAAGDVTDVFEKQIVIAAGEGAKSLLAAFQFMSTH
jgi:alkyl hydroperoxide reductase subunit F